MYKLFRKGFALILAIVLAASLIACSDESSDAGSTDHSQSEILPAFDSSIGIEEIELIKTKGVIITATELTYSAYEVTLELRIENTSKKSRTVYSNTASYCVNSINGYMIPQGYISCELAAGETKEESMNFSLDELYAHGISQIADIEVGFYIKSEKGGVKTGPLSIKTSAAKGYDYKTDTYLNAIKGTALKNAYGIKVNSLLEKELFSEGEVSLISEAIMTNKNGISILMLEFENAADQVLNVAIYNLSINGVTVNDSYVEADMICPGKKDILNVSLKRAMEKFEELKGKKIKKVSFQIKLQNEDYKDLTQKQKVTIEF